MYEQCFPSNVLFECSQPLQPHAHYSVFPYGSFSNSECIECEWCYNWEHKDCVGLSNDIYEVLGGAPANVMFFCTKCEPKVKLALKFFADIQRKQQAMDDKLRQLEEKFLNLSVI